MYFLVLIWFQLLMKNHFFYIYKTCPINKMDFYNFKGRVILFKRKSESSSDEASIEKIIN